MTSGLIFFIISSVMYIPEIAGDCDFFTKAYVEKARFHYIPEIISFTRSIHSGRYDLSVQNK